MSWFYRAAYAVGFTPWDRGTAIPQDDQVLAAVGDAEHGDRPYGNALDIGCGKGRYAIAVARRGWSVTGVDGVPKALRLARERARTHGAGVDFVEGDVTSLPQLVPAGFSLLLDMGCFHGMPDADRAAVVAAQEQVAAPGATLLIVAFQPSRGPGPRGVTRQELLSWYDGWSLVADEALSLTGRTSLERRAAPRLYRFRR